MLSTEPLLSLHLGSHHASELPSSSVEGSLPPHLSHALAPRLTERCPIFGSSRYLDRSSVVDRDPFIVVEFFLGCLIHVACCLATSFNGGSLLRLWLEYVLIHQPTSVPQSLSVTSGPMVGADITAGT